MPCLRGFRVVINGRSIDEESHHLPVRFGSIVASSAAGQRPTGIVVKLDEDLFLALWEINVTVMETLPPLARRGIVNRPFRLRLAQSFRHGQASMGDRFNWSR
jgi:hypothetical protein